MKLTLSIFLLCALSACTDPMAGMAAASSLGVRKCIAFEKDGRTETAAMIAYKGDWWFYHPTTSSRRTKVPTSKEPPLWVAPGGTNPRWVDAKLVKCLVLMQNGCLPMALADHRRRGGRLVESLGHIENIP